VVAHQEEGRYPSLYQALNAFGELSLVGRGGVSAFIGIPGEEDEMDIIAQGVIDDGVKGSQEIAQAAIQPRDWVKVTVILHPQVQVGEMQEPDHGLSSIP
jgi:hypothetical protein